MIGGETDPAASDPFDQKSEKILDFLPSTTPILKESDRVLSPNRPGAAWRLGARLMSEFESSHVRAETVDDVVVLSLLTPEIRTPIMAASVGKDLGEMVEKIGPARYVLNLKRTRFMSSTAFAVLLNFAKKVHAAGGILRLCAMDPEVRIGADIIGLGRFVPILDDESTAIAMYQAAE
jgi:anti-sigma B factor antagonist